MREPMELQIQRPEFNCQRIPELKNSYQGQIKKKQKDWKDTNVNSDYEVKGQFNYYLFIEFFSIFSKDHCIQERKTKHNFNMLPLMKRQLRFF